MDETSAHICTIVTRGGYGDARELRRGKRSDQFDIHRLVAYVGYTFSDWIRFHSEVEIEHAFLDFLLSDPVNIRFGR